LRIADFGLRIAERRAEAIVDFNLDVGAAREDCSVFC
jgi:hypothetical protein